ncbi:MAG: DUF3306 domain-containing protein [Rhodospirillaceae bacterium]|nr:DUF3306 domain-containing protein [Rhodospirillaceae bacterium]MBL6941794.1 DUF3306 domain-containing protein [Rhodospirillales bacterium]
MADKTFINRWSRTKLANTDKGDELDLLAEAPAQSASLPADPGDEAATTEEPIPPDLPSIESLDRDSDYTVFLGENVPEELAQKALRKLWTSNPAFANLDGLNDYDDDYSALGIVETVVKTAYKVGKGLVTEDEAEIVDEAEIEDEMAEDEPVAEEQPPQEETGDLPDDQTSQEVARSESPVPHGGKA